MIRRLLHVKLPSSGRSTPAIGLASTGKWTRSLARVGKLIAPVMAASLLIGCNSGGGSSDPFLVGSPNISKSGPIQVEIEGDSLALTLGIGLSGGQQEYGINITNDGHFGCGIASGGPIELAGVQYNYIPGTKSTEPDFPPNCPDWPQIWKTDLASAQPDVVAILVGRWETVNRFHDNQWMNILEPAYASYIEQQLEKAVSIVGSQGARVILFTMPYVAPGYAPNGVQYPETLPSRVDAFNSIVEKVASMHPSWVSVIDLNKMLDPNGVYTSQVGAVTTRKSDGTHISIAGGEMIAPKVLPIFQKLGGQVRNS